MRITAQTCIIVALIIMFTITMQAAATDMGAIAPSGWYNSTECTPWEEYQTRYECEDYSSRCNHDIYGYDCLTKMFYRDYMRNCNVYSEPGHVYVKTTTQYRSTGAVIGCCNICTMSVDPRASVLIPREQLPYEHYSRDKQGGGVFKCKQ